MNIDINLYIEKSGENQEILKRYLTYLKNLPSKRSIRRSKNTNYQNLVTANSILNYCNNDLSQYTKLKIEDWIEDYTAKYAAFSKIKNFTRFLYDSSLITEESYKRIMKMRFKNGKNGNHKFAIPQREWESLIDQLSGISRFALFLLFHTGIRVGELINLETTDLQLNFKTKQHFLNINDKTTKENKQDKWYPKSDSSLRSIKLGNNTAKIIKEFLDYRNTLDLSHNYLLYNTKTNKTMKRGERITREYTVNNWLNKIKIYKDSISKECKKCEDKKNHIHLTPHYTRFSYASHLYFTGKDKGLDTINEVSKLLGHSNVQTTAIYLKLDKQELDSRIDRVLSMANM